MASPVKAKKHLGQHFLTDLNIAQKIVNSLPKDDTPILEIGPGTGVITQYMVEKDNFTAFDIDTESIDFLKEKYPQHAHKFKFQDFLEADLSPFASAGNFYLIGNFPYNISTQIMFRVLEYRSNINCVVGMFQREVAQRIAEKPGTKTYGILSVLLQAFYKIEYLFTVSEHVFNPPPKVKSAVIRLTRNTTAKLNCDEELFFKVVKASFNQRRKTVRNSVKVLSGNHVVESVYLDKRAEQLSVNEFVELTNSIQQAIQK
ncbi:MAG: rRNA methyltransferase [Bacteroidetes bacterium]|jgi:16S rRNA (adenine1518-N6/adenine1519-N6)-dimethyltransferase|nr:rRNA methyltransferase [Bacteroidota bacterium]MDF2452404.1 rRNA methyltransferase [Bacteroidota bacterium]